MSVAIMTMLRLTYRSLSNQHTHHIHLICRIDPHQYAALRSIEEQLTIQIQDDENLEVGHLGTCANEMKGNDWIKHTTGGTSVTVKSTIHAKP